MVICYNNVKNIRPVKYSVAPAGMVRFPPLMSTLTLLAALSLLNDNQVFCPAIETFIALCKENDSEPILATIPCIPSKNHEGKNAWVRSSGYRYIDFAKAVNGQTYTSGSSNWYDGMLSTDNVHPTTLGAQALASQLLQDLPEIMQINH